MTEPISAEAELQMMMPSQSARARVSAEAVTCSEMWAWSTHVVSTPRVSAAASIMRFTSLPRVSVELQMEMPILIGSSFAAKDVADRLSMRVRTMISARALV